MSDESLRSAGFSRAKVAAIRDIAAKTLAGVVPSSRQIKRLSDDEIIARLIDVRGVGRWTVEMLLIFQLGRPDVLPADDFGVRTGFRIAYRRRELPKVKALLGFAERWRPHRTTAAWYLWQVANRASAHLSFVRGGRRCGGRGGASVHCARRFRGTGGLRRRLCSRIDRGA